MQRIALFTVVLLVLMAGLVAFSVREESTVSYVPRDSAFLPTIFVDGTPVEVFIADTPDEFRRGLSGRSALEPNQGMFFMFDTDYVYKIWMKDMKFPIDVLWISKEGVVVDIKEGIAPETYPKVFGPHTPVRYVLEVPAGFVEIYNIDRGDIVEF